MDILSYRTDWNIDATLVQQAILNLSRKTGNLKDFSLACPSFQTSSFLELGCFNPELQTVRIGITEQALYANDLKDIVVDILETFRHSGRIKEISITFQISCEETKWMLSDNADVICCTLAAYAT